MQIFVAGFDLFGQVPRKWHSLEPFCVERLVHDEPQFRRVHAKQSDRIRGVGRLQIIDSLFDLIGCGHSPPDAPQPLSNQVASNHLVQVHAPRLG